MDTKDPIEAGASPSVEEEAVNPDATEEAVVSEEAADQPEASSPRATPRRRWMRHPRKKVFGGVCGGMADYLSVSEGIVRLIWLALIVFSVGTALPLYILFWLFLPVGTSEEGVTAQATASLKAKHGVWAAWGLIAVGIALLASNLGIFDFLAYVGSMTIGPIILIVIGFYALKKFRARSNGTMREQVADLGAARQKVGAKLHNFSGLARSPQGSGAVRGVRRPEPVAGRGSGADPHRVCAAGLCHGLCGHGLLLPDPGHFDPGRG